MKKIILSITFILFIAGNIFGQSQSLYFNSNIFQSNDLNPARQMNCKVTIGLPVLSSVYLGYTNRMFAYKDLFYEDPTLPATARFVPDIEGLYSKLSPMNYILIHNRESLGQLGFWIRDFYFTIGGGLNIVNNMTIPKSMFLIKDGNYFENGNYFSMSGFGIDEMVYTDVSFGLSKEIIDGLVVGGKIKILKGYSNIYTDNFRLDWHVATEDTATYDWTFNTSYQVSMSQPGVNSSYYYDKFNSLTKSIQYKDDFASGWGFSFKDLLPTPEEILKYLHSLKNYGFGLDFGVIYTWKDKIEVSASVTDFGFITWKSNPITLTAADREFTFSGLDLAKYIGDNNVFSLIKDTTRMQILQDSMQRDLLDTIILLSSPMLDSSKYRTGINTKLNFGLAYTPADWVTLGFLYHGYSYHGKILSSYMLATTFKFWHGWSYSLTYTMFPKSFNNIGMGASYKLGPLQMYLQMDNSAPLFLMGRYAFSPDKPYNKGFATKWIKASKYMTFHFGINFIFGCRDNKDIGLID